MAFEVDGPVKLVGYTASADLSAKQFYFVKRSGAGTCTVCSATTDRPIGVLQNSPTSGQAAEITALGYTKINSDAALTDDAVIGTAVDGQAAAYVYGTDTTKYMCGVMQGATGAAGEIGTARINCINPPRGA